MIIIDTELYCNYSASHEAAHSSQPGTVCQWHNGGSPLGDWETMLDIVLELFVGQILVLQKVPSEVS